MAGRTVPLTDPLHMVSGPTIAWTRVNIAEGQPGVNTPLSWSWWSEGTERMIRDSYRDTGVVPLQRPSGQRPDDRTAAIFHGRPALNVDSARRGADLMPLLSANELELHFLGSVRPGVMSKKSRRWYPVIAAKTVPLLIRTPKLLARAYARSDRFWQENSTAAAAADKAGGKARLMAARDEFRLVGRPHSNVAWFTAPLFASLSRTAMSCGKAELILALYGGHESMEIETAADLWEVSRGRLEMDEFVRKHGFQGPMQGELSSRSWREDRNAVERLVATYRDMDDAADPRLAQRSRVEARLAAEAELLRALPAIKRPWARVLLRVARTYIPLRNIGKAGLQKVIDVARLSARAMGHDLVDRGVLDDPEDIFYLTLDELAVDLPDNVRDLVAFRRAKRDEYLSFELPESWVGNPERVVVGDDAGADVRGIPVSPGFAEGPARVLRDTASDDLVPGEILVCETTDPSYASYFLVAAGCVIDVGGALSHGAIAAREVAIPCVINTRDGTKKIRTGDIVRVDGTTGVVEIVKRSQPR